VKRIPFLRACGARPSAGWAIRAGMASRGKAGNNVEGGFLGGMRSARPRCKAELAPRHFISTTWVDDDPVAKGRQRWGWPYADVMGVQSPPLRGVDNPSWDGLAGKGQGMTRKAIFSEGRGLRARIARPEASRGIPFPPDGWQ